MDCDLVLVLLPQVTLAPTAGNFNLSSDSRVTRHQWRIDKAKEKGSKVLSKRRDRIKRRQW